MTEVDVDHFYLPRPKISEISGWLRDFVWQSEELDTVITMQAIMGNRYRQGGKSSETPMPFDESASDTAMDLNGTLADWINRVCSAGDKTHPGRLRTPGAAVWLRHHIIDMAKLEDAMGAYLDLDQLRMRVWRAIDKPAEKEPTPPADAAVAEGSATWLNQNGIVTCARAMGGPYESLTERRLRTLIKAGRVEAIACTVYGRLELFVLGDALIAHMAHPARKKAA